MEISEGPSWNNMQIRIEVKIAVFLRVMVFTLSKRMLLYAYVIYHENNQITTRKILILLAFFFLSKEVFFSF